jgi:hypothetical protein
MRIRIPFFALAFAAVLFSGCTKKVSQKHFQREHELHDMDRMLAMQSAAGARADGMLYAHHFSGTELNSLGRSKLHLMAADKPATAPLMVYLNTHDDRDAQARQSAITKYLHDHGLAASDVQIKSGHNPNATHSTAASLLRFSKTESGSAEGTVDSSGTNTGSLPPTVSGGK